MAKKKNTRAGYWEYHAAIIPVRFDFVPFGTGDLGSDVKVKSERPVLMQYVDDEAEWTRFYEALLKLPRLAPKIRVAIMGTLGRSQRAKTAEITRAETIVYKHQVDEIEARMRANDERPPKGDIRTAAIEKFAERIRMKPETLAKRLQRCSD